MKYDPITARRMNNALEASKRAQNPKFKQYWKMVFDQLIFSTALKERYEESVYR